MATLYDKQGRSVEIPDGQVLKALSSGEYGMQQDQRLSMIAPDGGVYELGIDDALGAAKEGWSYETGEQRRLREVQEKYGGFGGEVAAGAAGIARGLSFGLSDVALTKTGLAEEETLKGLQEANPAAGMVGEIGSIAASLLIPGAQGQAVSGGARLLRGLTAAPRAAARLGIAGEKAAARLIGPGAGRGLIGRIGARGAELGAGSAIEGALYGGGQAISEMALGDIDATAESLLGHVGMGAVIGGGFGAGLGSGFQSVKELVTGTGKLTKKGADSLVKLWEQQTDNKAIPGLSDAYAKIAEIPTGKPGSVSKLMGKEERRRAVQQLSKRDDVAREMAGIENDIREAYDKVFNATTGKQKQTYFRQIAKEGDEGAAARMADGILGEGQPILRDQTGVVIGGSGLISELDEAVKLASRAEGELGFLGLWKDLQAASKRAKRIIKAAEGKPDFAGRVHGALDDLKREAGKIRYDKMTRVRSPGDRDFRAMERADTIFKYLRKSLEDPMVWGKQAAKTQTDYNIKWVKYLKDGKRRSDHKFIEMYRSTGGELKVQAVPKGYRSYVDDLGSINNDLDEPWLLNQMETRQSLMDEALTLYDLPPKVMDDISKAKAALDRFKTIHVDAKKTVGLQNQLKTLEDNVKNLGFTTEMGVVGGALVGGPVGALVGGAIGAVLNPARTIRQLTTLERVAGGYKQRIKNGLRRYVSKHRAGKTRKKARRMIAPASVNALQSVSFGDGKRKAKNRQEAFKHRMEELHAFLQPQYGVDQLAKTTETVSKVAPQVAQTIQTKAMQAAQFLIERAPKNPGMPTLMGPDWKPSEIRLSKFERFVKAVDDPLSVVRDLENGTLTHEGVEALREVYPRLHEQIVAEITDNIDELRETLPYQERIQLSILFGVPVDPTMRPEFISSMQQSLVESRPNFDQMAMPSQAAKTQTFKPQFHMTQSQRLAAKQGGMT